MAMGKNKTGIMAAITAAAEASNAPSEVRDRAQRTLPKGTIGSVRSGLGGIQEIDTALVLAWGPKDRLDLELTAVNSDDLQRSIADLVDSISVSGQQVPVLLRPAKSHDGSFEVVYGRRRVLACRQLGIRVKALIRTLDDSDALRAKGLENANRAELSYYERARFAKAILEQGYPRAEATAALAISKNTLSQLERITRLVPDNVGDAIGGALGSGRPKWTALAERFEAGEMPEPMALKFLASFESEGGSDARLEALLSKRMGRGPLDRSVQEREPISGVRIKSGKSSLQCSVTKKGDLKDFADWLDRNLDDLITDAFERFQSEDPKG